MATRTRTGPAAKRSGGAKTTSRSSGTASAGRAGKRTRTPSAPPAAAAGGAPAGWTPADGEAGIRVRMYRVGFGDFFLVTFLGAQGEPHHVVIDCGVFKGTSQGGDIGSIEAAVQDMAQATGGQLDLIVVTHRHADHIAGFARCKGTFQKMRVGAVWMSAWESEYEPTAMKFQAELTRTALGLQRHFTALGARATPEQATARKYVENATGDPVAVAAAAAGGSNAVALNLLKHGFADVEPRYYKGGDAADLPQPLARAGVQAQILGPPAVDDLALMKLMDLQKGVGQYLAAQGEGDADVSAPFGPQWEVDPAVAPTRGRREGYAEESFREWVGPARKYWEPVTREEAQQARGRMEEALKQMQSSALMVAAKQLNSFLNNQSLVILFTFKGKRLLFVGDAQAGNWEHWLFETDTPDKKGTGAVTDQARQILTSLDFYKVGHHGSGNATPKAAVDMMCSHAQKFAAMCSTEAGVYGTEDPDNPTKGTEVPRAPLLDALEKQAALVRSDQIDISVDGKKVAAEVPAALPAPLRGSRFEKGALWIDCFL